jgi:hypothetical protein
MPRSLSLRVAFYTIVCLAVTAISSNAQIGGYLSSLSVAQGDSLSFFISTYAPQFDISIARLGDQITPITSIDNVSGGMQSYSDSAFFYGCHWVANATIAIPLSWKPGIYRAIVAGDSAIQPMVFVVKSKSPGSTSHTLVCLTANTWQAYNNWGGKSLYNFNSSNKQGSVKVSFDRPFSVATAAMYSRWTDKLVSWLDRNNFDAEYCTNQDLDRNPHLLDNYDVYCTVGHDEYWSRPERNEIQSFVDRGGRVIVLSGNTCWWQVRFENNLHTLVCWRDPLTDPLIPNQDSIATVVWSRPPLNQPPNLLLGANFEHGGYVNDGALYPDSLGYGGYTAYRTTSWIYDGTNVEDGDVIGQSSAIVGYEVDGVDMKWMKGFPIPTGSDQTPLNFYILGISPESDSKGVYTGNATMGYMTNVRGGAVFNAATTNWVNGLDTGDSNICQITNNIFTHFRARRHLPPEIVSYSPETLSQDTIVHEAVYLSHRTIEISADVPDVFQVQAVDPGARPLKYTWTIDGKLVGEGPMLTVTSRMKQQFIDQAVVSVSITNGADSISMDWTMIDTMIRFVTMPPQQPLKNKMVFQYKPKAVSLIDDRPKYRLLNAPPWLKLSKTGELHVTIDTVAGMYPVSILATDRYGHTARQTFRIFIIDTVQSEQALLSKDGLQISNFPNPFTNQTTIAFSLHETSRVTLSIYNSLGVIVKRVLTSEPLESGTIYDFGWDGTDDHGDRLAAGIYFCRFWVDPHSHTASEVIRMIVKD